MSTPTTALPGSPEVGWETWLARAHLDLWLTVLLFLLAALGLSVLYSASGHSAEMVISQAQRFALGLFVMLACAQVPPELYRALAPWFYGGTLVLLVLVLALGDTSKGAQRWLDFGVRFQPSELMKLAMPLMIAAFLHGRALPPRVVTVLITLTLIGVPTLLIVVQPDLGTGMLVVCAGVFALYFGGWGWRWIAAGVGGFAAAAYPLWHMLHDYQRQRVLTFLDPESDPLGAGYHITQSKIAIGSGGLFGKGFLNGTQSHLAYLPEGHTDFVFATMSEEWGLAGGVALIVAFALVIRWAMMVSLNTKGRFERLTAAGIAATLFFYVAVNLLMVMGLAPVVGIPLPIFSYGGSAQLTFMICMGILMSIDRDNRSDRHRSRGHFG